MVSPEVLRHPSLDKPYFQELFEAWPIWRDDIHKQIIYDAYFGEADNEGTVKYLNKIIEYAKGRPVIQECRTASRINTLKNELGGFHIYLWRNPWDQWWSYKAAYYFDITSQLILNTTVHPEAITRLRQEIGFTEFHHEDLTQEISYFNENRLSAEHSYLAFYLLWCLGLLEGCAYADYLLNIDALNDSEKNKDIAMKHLTDCDVPGIDFSDCRIPQTYYSSNETSYFVALEERIHGILLLSGFTQKQLNDLLELRKRNEPKLWSQPVSDIPCEALLTQSIRGRNIAIRYETEYFTRLNQKNRQLQDLQKRAECLDNEWDSAKLRESNLTNLLAGERENVSRLQTELTEIHSKLTFESIRAQQRLEEAMNMTRTQQSEYVQREQEFNSQLQNSQQALLNLQDSLVQREHFITELQAEHLRTVQKEQNKYAEAVKLTHKMQRHIDLLNTENNTYRKEITTCNEMAARTQGYLSELVSGLQQINEPPGYATVNGDSVPEHLSEGPSAHVADTLNELLQYHDKQFISCAYQTLLGRMPDPEGFQYYLGRLRSGISKYEILAQMRFSKEGKTC